MAEDPLFALVRFMSRDGAAGVEQLGYSQPKVRRTGDEARRPASSRRRALADRTRASGVRRGRALCRQTSPHRAMTRRSRVGQPKSGSSTSRRCRSRRRRDASASIPLSPCGRRVDTTERSSFETGEGVSADILSPEKTASAERTLIRARCMRQLIHKGRRKKKVSCFLRPTQVYVIPIVQRGAVCFRWAHYAGDHWCVLPADARPARRATAPA